MIQTEIVPNLFLGIGILTPVLTVAGAYWSVRYGLDGTRKDVNRNNEALQEFKAEIISDVRALKADVRALSLQTAAHHAEHSTRIEHMEEKVRHVEDRLSGHLEDRP